jgi:4-amino-4-deoxy-L-arabinose transferase-like glycosyltransferase
MTKEPIIGSLVFVAASAFNLWLWRRRSHPLPKYVHALAILGVIMAVALGLQDPQDLRAHPFAYLALAGVLPAVVYLAFGFYGRAVMPDDDSEDDDDAA